MNEVINMTPYYITIFICILSYNLCYSKLNNIKFKFNKKNIFIILLMSIIVLINNKYCVISLKLLLNIFIIIINFKILFKDSFKTVSIYYILIFFITVLAEIVLTNILGFVGLLKESSSAITFNYIKIILSIIVSIVSYLVINIKIIKKLINYLVKFFDKQINLFNISYLLFICIAIFGMLNINIFATENSVRILIVLFIIFIVLFGTIIKSKTKEEYLKNSNNKLIEYNEKYGQFLDEYKIYKHNIKHKLVGIKTYGNKKVNELIDDLLEEETTFSIKNNELYNVPNGIKGIVAEKLYNTSINVIIDNKIKGDPFRKLKPREFNSISESIGICLDNALEACEETSNPIIVMDLYEDDENAFVKIGNNFTNCIDIEKIGNMNYSTKNRNSGFGLFSIIQNKIIKEKISIINDIYYIELKIKKHAD